MLDAAHGHYGTGLTARRPKWGVASRCCLGTRRYTKSEPPDFVPTMPASSSASDEEVDKCNLALTFHSSRAG